VREALACSKPDAVFVPGIDLPVLADLDSQVPAIAWCDVTFAQLVDYYPASERGDIRRPGFSNLSRETLLQATEGERAAMRKCSLLVFTSQWAASSAIDSYGVDPTKVLVAPFGANLTNEASECDVARMVARRSRDQCNLLFLGGEWKRKGGPHALEVAERLNRLGLRTTLTIVGCSPPVSLLPFVKLLGYVNKGAAGGEDTLCQLLEQSHFVILPSIADCTPIAVSEGCSRGVPSLARATGAVGEVVSDGRNGKLFSPDADAEEWSAFVLRCFNDWEAYSDLAASSFDEYQNRLSWRRNGNAVAAAVRELT
jgi:glycosyltransferase involved in cell wall biosynthesis